jgi:hypothetical protein
MPSTQTIQLLDAKANGHRHGMQHTYGQTNRKKVYSNGYATAAQRDAYDKAFDQGAADGTKLLKAFNQ